VYFFLPSSDIKKGIIGFAGTSFTSILNETENLAVYPGVEREALAVLPRINHR